jgi:hypothetical protein
MREIYDYGLDVLGADSVAFAPVPSTVFGAQSPSRSPSPPILTADKIDLAAEAARRAKGMHQVMTALGIGAAGVAVAGTVGAVAWRKRRVLGFLLGAILGGPILGGGGAAVYMKTVNG